IEVNSANEYPVLTQYSFAEFTSMAVATGTCATAIEVNSADEYWVKTGSLLHTDTEGRDLKDPDHVRFFLLSGTERASAGAALRALFIALDQWVNEGVRPPKSQVPRQSGNAVYSVAQPSGLGIVPQGDLGFPSIPGVLYTGVITVRHLFDFGPLFDEGILTI